MKKTFYFLWCFMVFCTQHLLKAETAPVADFILPDGTLNTYAMGNQQLSLDLGGWHIALDPKRGPVFSLAPPPLTDTWSALGAGLDNTVSAIAVSGSDIYVGGSFTAVGGGTAVAGLNHIAKWNGTAWSALDAGLDNSVFAIAVSGSDIYVGGTFTGVGAGGTAVTGLSHIAKWNGTAWSALDAGLSDVGVVYSIAVSSSDIYVGGGFVGVGTGGTAVTGLTNIAKWNGTAWSALDAGLGGTGSLGSVVVYAVAVSGSDVYVGGGFTSAALGGTQVAGLNRIAKWNGTAWSALDKGLSAQVTAITVSGNDIYVGGLFTAVGSGGTAVTGLSNIAKWNGTAWSALDRGLGNVTTSVRTIAVHGSDIYVGGAFNGVSSGGTVVAGLSKIAKWNGAAWSALDKGLSALVFAIAVSGNDVYVGGSFTAVGSGGTAVAGLNHIAKWSPNVALPVELVDFKGQNTEGGNLLTWTTANEVNNKGFQVERITDNGQWIILGFKPANNQASEYQFTDNVPCRDKACLVSTTFTNYYRLRQIDNDGKETLSKVISISTKGNSKLITYPNPVSNILTIETNNAESFQIINLLGQEILTGKATQRIDVSSLPQGNYILKVGAEQVKFIKM